MSTNDIILDGRLNFPYSLNHLGEVSVQNPFLFLQEGEIQIIRAGESIIIEKGDKREVFSIDKSLSYAIIPIFNYEDNCVTIAPRPLYESKRLKNIDKIFVEKGFINQDSYKRGGMKVPHKYWNTFNSIVKETRDNFVNKSRISFVKTKIISKKSYKCAFIKLGNNKNDCWMPFLFSFNISGKRFDKKQFETLRRNLNFDVTMQLAA